ncbi:MAG: hypothetical protein ACYTEL_11490 [Planctomycetota bacterium]|jgi:hypothetical protein
MMVGVEYTTKTQKSLLGGDERSHVRKALSGLELAQTWKGPIKKFAKNLEKCGFVVDKPWVFWYKAHAGTALGAVSAAEART